MVRKGASREGAGVMADERHPVSPYSNSESVHEVLLHNREHLRVKGVLHVESFDDRQIVLDTDLGTLTIEGEDLQIKQLDLEAGDFAVAGLVSALTYSVGGAWDLLGKCKSLIDPLLR